MCLGILSENSSNLLHEETEKCYTLLSANGGKSANML